MALIKCPECGEKVSEYAHSCPKCGKELVKDIRKAISDINVVPDNYEETYFTYMSEEKKRTMEENEKRESEEKERHIENKAKEDKKKKRNIQLSICIVLTVLITIFIFVLHIFSNENKYAIADEYLVKNEFISAGVEYRKCEDVDIKRKLDEVDDKRSEYIERQVEANQAKSLADVSRLLQTAVDECGEYFECIDKATVIIVKDTFSVEKDAFLEALIEAADVHCLNSIIALKAMGDISDYGNGPEAMAGIDMFQDIYLTTENRVYSCMEYEEMDTYLFQNTIETELRQMMDESIDWLAEVTE